MAIIALTLYTIILNHTITLHSTLLLTFNHTLEGVFYFLAIVYTFIVLVNDNRQVNFSHGNA
jgi:hypothetical protein